jgi:FAD/FMN-containing dehydrogenase
MTGFFLSLAAVRRLDIHRNAIGVEKKTWLSNTRSAVGIVLKKKLKAFLDPNNILNPGRLIGQVVATE